MKLNLEGAAAPAPTTPAPTKPAEPITVTGQEDVQTEELALEAKPKATKPRTRTANPPPTPAALAVPAKTAPALATAAATADFEGEWDTSDITAMPMRLVGKADSELADISAPGNYCLDKAYDLGNDVHLIACHVRKRWQEATEYGEEPGKMYDTLDDARADGLAVAQMNSVAIIYGFVPVPVDFHPVSTLGIAESDDGQTVFVPATMFCSKSAYPLGRAIYTRAQSTGTRIFSHLWRLGSKALVRKKARYFAPTIRLAQGTPESWMATLAPYTDAFTHADTHE